MRCYKMLLLFLVMVMGVSCALKKDLEPQAKKEVRIAQVLTKDAQVSVYVNPEEVPPGKSPEELLKDKAAQKGVARVLGPWLRDKYLFVVGNNTLWTSGPDFLDFRGGFQAQQDELTRSYSQLFKVSIALAPVTQAMGSIDSLEDKLGMGGQGHYCTIRLGDLRPKKTAYFLVCRNYALEGETGYVQSIAYGKIYNVLDGLAQGVILQSAKEVEDGDQVFLLRTRVSPVVKAAVPSISAGVEEVVVEPKMRPQEIKEPAESK